MAIVVQVVPLALFTILLTWRADYKRAHDGAEPPNWKRAAFAFVGAWIVFVAAATLVADL